MSILNNALDSIAIGLEDYESTDKRRLLSSTRNIFAGILLLFKHRLSELSAEGSDEALIKQRVLPKLDDAGEIKWVGSGPKTVDVHSIKERFKSLKIDVDWSRLDKINRYRNEIEHYHSSLNSESVQLLISYSFILVRDFISDELNEEPKTLLGEKYWKILVDVNEVYLKEKSECNDSLEQLVYQSDDILSALKEYRCSACGSDLLETPYDSEQASEASFTCRACDTEYAYCEIVNAAVSEYHASEVYSSIKDGGETPIVACPTCHEGAYLVRDGFCVLCGVAAAHECERCGGEIPPEELSEEKMCGYCMHVWQKYMAE